MLCCPVLFHAGLINVLHCTSYSLTGCVHCYHFEKPSIILTISFLLHYSYKLILIFCYLQNNNNQCKMCWKKALTCGVGSVQLIFHIFVFKYPIQAKVFQSKCYYVSVKLCESLHFSIYYKLFFRHQEVLWSILITQEVVRVLILNTNFTRYPNEEKHLEVISG